MKNYEETAESVFRRSNAIIKKRAERRKTLRLITSVLSCFLLVLLFGTDTSNGVFNRTPFEILDVGTSQYQSTASK